LTGSNVIVTTGAVTDIVVSVVAEFVTAETAAAVVCVVSVGSSRASVGVAVAVQTALASLLRYMTRSDCGCSL
jgi:hypothetical protein